ncbi:hypothetical protein [Chryseobacterium sp. YIM B08800]|uniref:hypothetical protein n=1 Tax=Chryseobacterium sp. YIM B08800 TaxID=2984136 RepID=UPI00223F46D9|nr:hypothetical protein [Chryseobacterium sp. YIM B08800]
MLNPNLKSKNQRQSKFLGNRRRRLLNRIFVPVLPANADLSVKQKTDIFCKTFAGVFHVKYKSQETGRFAQGFGATLEIAFTNMHNHFNEKYQSYVGA